MAGGPLRPLGITVGAAIILAIGLYGPATLLGPLPELTVTPSATTAPPAAGAGAGAFTLPDTGASAVVLVDGSTDAPYGTESNTDVYPAEPLAMGGSDVAVPIGGMTKFVTVLAALEAKPFDPGEPGASVPIRPADYAAFIRYRNEGARVVDVSPGDTWTERDMFRAVLLASSNNHADALSAWAFGSIDAGVSAGNEWLAANGFTQTTIVDATGLGGGNVGTAAESAALAVRIANDPVMSELYASATSAQPTERFLPDVSTYRADDGLRALSRSYTDQAGLCFAFTAVIGEGEGSRTVAGSLLGLADYDALDEALSGFIAELDKNAEQVTVITEGDAYATVSSAWGARARAVSTRTQSVDPWSSVVVSPADVEFEPVTTAPVGTRVGRVTIGSDAASVSSPLALDSTIRGPGVLWRLTHPMVMIAELLG